MSRLVQGGSAVPVYIVNMSQSDSPYVFKSGGQLTGTLDANGQLIINLTDRASTFEATISTSTYEINPNIASKHRYILEDSPIALTIADGVDGDSFTVVFDQGSTGSRLITWSDVNWGDTGEPTLSTGIGDRDVCVFMWDDGEWLGFTSGTGF